MGVGHVNNFQFISGLYLKVADRKFPLFLYMERLPQRGQQNEQLHLLACASVPRPVEATLHPSAFAPRRSPQAGHVQDPGRPHMMWQEGENGPVTFQVQNMIFWVAHPGAPIFRSQGTMSKWKAGVWNCIGTLGTQGVDRARPEDDILRSGPSTRRMTFCCRCRSPRATQSGCDGRLSVSTGHTTRVPVVGGPLSPCLHPAVP